MIVTKTGVLPEDKIYSVVCVNCKTEFEFKQSEASVMNDRNEIVLLVSCPVCNKNATVMR